MQVMRSIARTVLLTLKILFKALLFVPIPALLIWLNYTIDARGYFHGDHYEREVAQALIAGKDLVGYDQLDERAITEMYVRSIETPPDTIALGSSRILQLTAEIADADSFFNCGMSGADIRDILGTFYLFDRAGKLPNNLIIGLDPWILNGDADAYNPKSNEDLYNEFLTLKLGVEAGYTKPDESYKKRALISPAYLQENLDYHFNRRQLEPLPATVEGNLLDQPTNVKRFDGSVLYNRAFRNAGPEEVEARAHAEAGTFMRMEGFLEPDPELRDVFDRFIQYALEQGVNVIFVLPPYHPLVYVYAQEYSHNYPGFFKTEPWFILYARRNGIPLYGSFNPMVTGTLEENFYDGLHIRGEAISTFFPGVREVLRQQQTGLAGSPWMYTPPRVDEAIAAELLARRYEISAPEVLVRGEDGWIYDQYCYLFHRYASAEENAILLASYAVSQDSGNIYRWDTDTNQWLLYTQFV